MPLRSERRFISKNDLQSGMMVEFSYTKRDSTTGTYTVIIIDPAKKAGDDAYLHGLVIDNLSDMELVRLSTEIGKEFNYDPSERKAPITYLQSDAAYERYKASGIVNERLYRTFLLSNVSNPRQILIGELE